MNDTRLGRYHLTRVLGRGAMGVVYEARDPHLDRGVAVKTALTRDLPADQVAAYERRFLTEARSAARLRHPSIVSVFDAGKDGDTTYLVMELVNGVNLKHCLTNGVRFTPAGAVRLVLSVLQGLEHAHGQRVIHRDVKPENVLLEPSGVAKLTDFGIAKVLEADMDNGTQVAGLSIGTPRYMSPEQVRGQPVDARTDLYSAGVLLFELLTATTPFDGANPLAIAAQILSDVPPLPSARAQGVPPELDTVVHKALAKCPADRFQSAGTFCSALTEALGAPGMPAPDAEAGPEPAMALVEADSGPILRWLFAQACADHASPAVPPVAALPDTGTSGAGATAPRQLPALDGTRVVQREAGTHPTVELSSQSLSGGPAPQAAAAAVQPAVPMASPPAPRLWRKGLWVVPVLLAVTAAWWVWRAASPAPAPPAEPFEEMLEDRRAAPSVPQPPPAEPLEPLAKSVDVPVAGGVPPQPAPSDVAKARRDAKGKADASRAVPPPAGEVGPAPVPPTEPQPPVPQPPVPKPSDSGVGHTKPAPPHEPCTGLSFFEREACLWTQCATDAFRRHPACKRFNPDKPGTPMR